MYYFRQKGKLYLDLRGNFILTHNSQLAKKCGSSAGPSKLLNCDYSKPIPNMNFFRKLELLIIVIVFIFTKQKTNDIVDSGNVIDITHRFENDYDKGGF